MNKQLFNLKDYGNETTEQAYVNEFQYQLDLYRASNIGGVYTVRMDDQFTLLYGNDLYFQVHEFEPGELLGKSCEIFIHPQDLTYVHDVLTNARKEKMKNVQWEMRIITGKKNIKHILVSGSFHFRNGEEVFDGCIMDTSKSKEMERRVRESEEKFRIATENSDLTFWTYYFDTKEIHQNAESRKIHGHDFIVQDVPESLVKCGYIREDSKEAFLDLYRRLEAGEKNVSGAFWYENPSGDGWWCEHISYTTVFDENGNPVCAHAVGKDVTDQKIAELRYNEETSYRNAVISKNIISILQADVTTGEVEDIVTSYQEIKQSYLQKDYDSCVSILAEQIPDEHQRLEFLEFASAKTLIKDFECHQIQKTLQVQRKMPNGSCLWVSMVIKLFQKPNSDHIVVFLYSNDINNETLYKQIMDVIAQTSYDFLGYINLVNDSHFLLANKEENNYLKIADTGYESSMTTFLSQFVEEQERSKLIEQMLLCTVTKELESKSVYSVEYTLKRKNGELRCKQVRFAYVDRISRTLLYTQSDITDIINKEKIQQEALHDALVAAEQANKAKTEFLSRMSHEIRTPMNAIIGMSTLAAQMVNDPEAVADCLSKVGISARFLLSLINDILDMSRIESGKVSVKQEKIPFEEFINGINTISYAQARDKGVDYDAIITSFTEDCYIGDAMKLQQVLINIIGNAIKFTPSGGKVQLIISQERQTKNSAMVKFVINDTGIGISEEFIPHLFESFAQQHIGSTSMYGGTGLGLAICKNLIDLMDGEISVNSIEGVGTEFTVDVQLGISQESHKKSMTKQKMSFEKMNALVVDDDILICHHTEKILQDMGIKADYVVSGRDAVEKVKELWDKGLYYNIILIDWKMPDMDGIETTRKLRKIVGPEVTIIIMTAYDWSSIENEAKCAGVNLLITKPLFKSSLCSAFERIYHEKEEHMTPPPIETYDFTGKRVLLVEDHMLNIEVAKRLLTAKNLEVEVAENGLLCIERFIASPVGYFDAIIMDIRMPVMDGLTATKSIRQMRKKDAKEIPIIAMTANAFEEDIEKTKAAGMNAHLAKPIEPAILYQTLSEFIF